MIQFLKSISRMEYDRSKDNILEDFLNNKSDDWRILKMLYQHKVQFLFLKHTIEQNRIELLNNKIGFFLSSQLSFNNQLYKEYLNNIGSITEGLKKEKTPFCLIKGFSISDDIYKKEGVVYRPFSDVDILIDKKNVKAIHFLLENHSFIQGNVDSVGRLTKAPRSELIYWSLNSHQEHVYRKDSCLTFSPFVKINFDINTTIFEGGKTSPPISTEVLLKQLRDRIICGVSTSSLSYDYELIQLCYHFYKDTQYESKKASHNDYCLIKFCDIREYIIHYKKHINWDHFIEAVNEANIGNQIYYSLRLVDLFYEDLEIDSILNRIKKTVKIDRWNVSWNKLLLY